MRKDTLFAMLLVLGCAALCACTLLAMNNHASRERVAAIETSAQADTDAVERFRTLRQQMRAMERAQLNDIAHDAAGDAELVAMAKRQLLDICAWEERELTIEGVLEMRGFAQPVVTVHADSVNVILRSEGITQQQGAVILELVCRETGVQAGNVKIIPVHG